MKRFSKLFLLFQFVAAIAVAQTRINYLRCENLSNPIGIDSKQPYLSWELIAAGRNISQTAYEYNVSSSPEFSKKSWTSNKVNSDQSVNIPYNGEALQSGKKYFWRVRVWDNKGKVSAWSATASWQMGLLQPSDWKASWIKASFPEDNVHRPSPVFRKEFSTAKSIKSATAFITSHGLYEAFINGERIGDAYLTPGWTSYNKRLQYQVYDVTSLLKKGSNAFGVALGSGWYRGNIGWGGNLNFFGKDLALLCQLEINYTDGSSETIETDGSWKSSTAEIRSSDIYNGETIDARLAKNGWTRPAFNDQGWQGVTIQDLDKTNLVATCNEPVRKHETFKPVKVFRTPKNELVVDFGQNLVGFVQLKLQGKKGDSIVLHHAEVLDKTGNFYTENLRSAKQQNTYILNGEGKEVFEPHFTFQGFRYVKIDGLSGEPDPADIIAVAMYSDMKPTGSFTSSDPMLNQLQHNIQWGQKGNFLDVPTDCPQRDERLGWTGDAQVFSRTASFNMDVNNFFRKWMKDVAADQLPDGSVPFVIPNVLGKDAAGSTGWADVSTIIPWNMYLAYGDKRILEEQYASMKAWVGFIEQKSKNDLWNTGFHFGDWLFYRPDDDTDGMSAITDKYLIAQCFYACSVEIMIKTARVLGRKEDEAKYSALLNKIRQAFLQEYVTPNGRLVSGSQTAYVLTLQFDMLPESLRASAAQRLADNVKLYNYHLTTGFLGTPYLCHVLSRFGYHDLAYTLLMQDSYPSWLYPVKMGATTIWERWDGIKPDSTFENAGMNSFNHYAYGAIGDWMYREIAGIDTDPEITGYKKITIRPNVFGKKLNPTDQKAKDSTGSLTEVAATLQTYYGQLSSHWKLEKGQLHLMVEIPANTTATIYVPAVNVAAVKEGGKPVADDVSIQKAGTENGSVVLKVGSGKYHFTVE
jgi:alpha-L-rhamnosidase